MLRNYETMFIVNPSIVTDDQQLEAVMEKYRQLVTDNGGEVQQLIKWDRRRLAYEINGQREGIYLLLNFKAEPRVSKELDRVFKINDDILRHMIIVLDEKRAAAEIAKASSAAQSAALVETPEEDSTGVDEPIDDLTTPETEAASDEQSAVSAEEESSVETETDSESEAVTEETQAETEEA